MHKHIASALAAASLAVIGCGSSGLSLRETSTQNYALYMHSMYDAPADAAARPPATVTFPVRLGVAQVGEVAPPAAMLETLRERRELFAAVEGLPGAAAAAQAYSRPYHPQKRAEPPPTAADGAREHLRSMCRMARDMGMTHLLVFGGTIDHDTNSTGLSVLDLTIVGAFVVPSREIRASARASGAMIDVETESVVLVATADSDRSRLTPTAAQDNDTLKLMQRMRDELVEELTASFISKCDERAQRPMTASVPQ